MRIKSLILAALCMVTVGVYAQSNYPFNGLDMNMGNLSRLSDAKTRSISPENFTGEKGKGGMADPVRDKDQRNVANAHHAAKDLGKGWKVNPFIIVKPGETITIAEIEGPGAIQQIWMTPTGNWRFSILRMYWDDEKEPSVECPVGDFFCSAYNEYAQLSSLAVCVNPGSAFNCYWKMPFRKKARITLENINTAEEMRLYYQINYTLTEVPEDEAYFHAQFRRSNPTQGSLHTLIDGVKGKGQYVGLLGAGYALNKNLMFANSGVASTAASFSSFPTVRKPISERNFKSPAIEKAIATFKQKVKNEELGWLFGNCFPNTLDTTVFYSEKDGRPDTYVITGDIDAMWLRDSSAQVYPYLDFMSEDKNLQRLIIGVINKQTSFILKDPYANAFYDDDTKYTRWNSDHTEMKPGIHERKYELDSLCYPIRLAYGYWKKTNDASPFDAQWKKAIETVLRVCKEQQRKDGNGPYSFRRTSEWAIDAVPMGGVGYKVNPVGLICSTFRPSDDATIFPFLVPSNFFAVASLRQASEMVQKITKDNVLADELLALSKEVYNALQTYAVVNHPKFGKIYAFEIDGFGSAYLSDDANVPNLLALPYLGGVDSDDAIYANTRRFVWSEYNPYFFKGSYFEGIGGHHIGTDMIWPMSLIMKALTAQDDKELQQCIQMLQKTHAGTGFMHESFHKDDPKKFTRSWFAWANTLFGELLWKTFNEKPYLLEY